MVRTTMLAPLGFREDRLLPAIDDLGPDHVVILHTDHPSARSASKRALKALAERDITGEDEEVGEAFDFVAWYRAFDAAAERLKNDEIVVNLTASHGVALTMAGFVAAKRALAAIVLDTEGTGLHHLSPAIVFHLEGLGEKDREVLRALRRAQRSVSAVQNHTGFEMSTTSAVLRRLHDEGFLQREQSGRVARYGLRPGVAEFLETIIGIK